MSNNKVGCAIIGSGNIGTDLMMCYCDTVRILIS